MVKVQLMYYSHSRVVPELLLYGYRYTALDRHPCTNNDFLACTKEKLQRRLTFMASTGVMLPDCHTLVIVPRAGIPERMSVPEAIFPSSSVGSSQISSPTAACKHSQHL